MISIMYDKSVCAKCTTRVYYDKYERVPPAYESFPNQFPKPEPNDTHITENCRKKYIFLKKEIKKIPRKTFFN
jgi:hypothetical protein